MLGRLLTSETWLSRFLIRHSARIRGLAFAATLAVYPVFCALSWLRVLSRRVLGLRPAVVWGPTPILTIAESSALLRRLGYPSTTVVFTVYHIRQDFDVNLQRLIYHPAVGWWLPNALFLWSLLKFDVFQFFYDGGLWSGMKIVPWARRLELPLLRLAGKRVIASAYGADVRTRAANDKWQPYNICQECPEPGKFCICDSARGSANAKHHRDWCNAVLAMGDMHDEVFDSRVDFVYWPIDAARVPYAGARPHAGPVRLVHSPNHRYFKGTRFIEQAAQALRAKGYDVELRLVEGVTNEEARRAYAEADVVVAQCLAGWIGYTEVEAMAAGKPVVSYLRDPRYTAHLPDLPIVSASPSTLEQELERLVADPALREELGRRGRRHVEEHWSYEALAPRFDALHREIWEHNDLGRTLRRNWSEFVRGESRYRVGRPLSGPVLGEWPVHSDPVLNMRRIEAGVYGQPPFDAGGLPRMYHAGRYVDHLGVTALYALSAFHCMLADPKGPAHRDRFLAGARRLRDSLDKDSAGVGRWFYRFEPVDRGTTAPSVSCFSQGLGLSILLRAEQAAPGQGFGEAAACAVRLFRIPVREEGLLWEENGDVFLEEYPEDPPPHVLNGFITGLFGLHEHHRATGEAWTAELFARCASTLRRALRRYESRRGLRYDLAADEVMSADYIHFVVQQLRALHAMTGERVYLLFAWRWRAFLYATKLWGLRRAASA